MTLPQPPVPGVRHRSVDVGGLPVHLAEAGDPEAPPLLLLHGWPQHWYAWRRVVPLLRDTHRLLLPDLRGLGWSGAPRGGYDKEQLATDLLGLLDAVDLPRVQLVGHDWGGWTGFLACLRAPERFSSFLALSVPHPFQRPDARLLQMWRAAYQLPLSAPLLGRTVLQTVPAAVEQLLRSGSSVPGTFSRQDLAAYSRVLAQPARARASTLLYRTFLLREAGPVWAGRYRASDLRVPTRLVAGADDLVVHPDLLRGWDGVPDTRGLALLPGVGHFLPEEAPQVVADAVRELPGVERASGS